MTSPSSSRIDGLRRPTDGRIIAGVSTSIARELNIDPVLVRIGFVVLVFVGLAGPLLYAAYWLLVPSEGKEQSPIGELFDVEAESDLRKVGLIVAAMVAALAVLGDTRWGGGAWLWGTLWIGVWVGLPAAAIYWYLVVRPRTKQPDSQGLPAANASDWPGAHEPQPEQTVSTGTLTAPPRRSTWSPVLLLLTGFSILIAMGSLALWALVVEPVAIGVYFAAALAIVSVGLLVGTRYGQAGLLVPLGLLLSFALLVSSTLTSLDFGEVVVRPETAAEIAKPIELGFGRVEVDLTGVSDLDSLTGRTLEIHNGAGQTVVVLPEELVVDVNASLAGAGAINVLGLTDEGISPQVDSENGTPGAFQLELTGIAGEIKVEQR
ncbi:MAG TPA: PspC domain-containing protein [Aeromicrobium sp.]|nr:PspC domain-containing protein [Aeromicrobium sp.]